MKDQIARGTYQLGDNELMIQGTYAAQPDVIEERIHEALLALAKADPEVAAYFTQQGLQDVADQLGDERGV